MKKLIILMFAFVAIANIACTEEVVSPRTEDPKYPCGNCSLPNPGKP